MSYKSVILVGSVLLAGCSKVPRESDWAMDCQRNYSETKGNYAACMAERAKMPGKASAAAPGAAVTTTPTGDMPTTERPGEEKSHTTGPTGGAD